MRTSFALLMWVVAALCGCSAHFDVVALDPADVAAHRATAKAVCVARAERVDEYPLRGLTLQLDPSDGPPSDWKPTPPTFRRYLLGPNKSPRLSAAWEPLMGIGALSIVVGGLGSAISMVALWGCAEADGCNEAVPTGTALAGLGLAVVGGVMLIVGATGDTRSARGAGELCDGAPKPGAPAPVAR